MFEYETYEEAAEAADESQDRRFKILETNDGRYELEIDKESV